MDITLLVVTWFSAIFILNQYEVSQESDSSYEESSLLVKTNSGTVRGHMEEESVRVFRGIPFAAPPVGDLRWSEPQPAVSWEGVRDATEFGADCLQALGPIGSRKIEKSEDCLYLNGRERRTRTGHGLDPRLQAYGGPLYADSDRPGDDQLPAGHKVSLHTLV